MAALTVIQKLCAFLFVVVNQLNITRGVFSDGRVSFYQGIYTEAHEHLGFKLEHWRCKGENKSIDFKCLNINVNVSLATGSL